MRVRARVRPEDYRWREGPFGEPVAVTSSRVEVEVSSLGWSRRAWLELALVEHAQRLAPEQRLVDRRGAVPSVRWRRVAVRGRAEYAPGRASATSRRRGDSSVRLDERMHSHDDDPKDRPAHPVATRGVA
jgi:hypothetical protein